MPVASTSYNKKSYISACDTNINDMKTRFTLGTILAAALLLALPCLSSAQDNATRTARFPAAPTYAFSTTATISPRTAEPSATGTHRYYCEMREVHKAFARFPTFLFDFGSGYVSKGLDNYMNILVDGNGNEIQFRSRIDAANYLSEFGWILLTVCPDVDEDSTDFRWIFYKDAASREEAKAGLVTLREFMGDPERTFGNFPTEE